MVPFRAISRYFRQYDLQSLSLYGIVGLTVFSILWRGGKTLPATWLLLAIGALSIASLVSAIFRKKSYRCDSRTMSIWIVILAFIVWTAISLLHSQTANYGLDELLRTAGLGFIYIWILCQDKKNADHFTDTIIKVIAWTAITSCIIGCFIYIFQPMNRFVATFFDYRFHTDYWPNAAADMLLLSWPIVALATANLKQSTIMQKIVRHLPLALIFGCGALTYSRGAVIAFVGQIILLIGLLGLRRSYKKDMQILLRIGTALVLSFIVFFGVNTIRSTLHPIQDIGSKITFSSDEGTSSISERTSFWRQSWSLTQEKSLFGWGPYSFRFVQPRLQRAILATSDHSHNVFLKLGMERGIPAAILFGIIIVLSLLSGALQSVRHTTLGKQDGISSVTYPLFTISVAGVLAHSLIDYNLQFVGIALPLWILLALLFRRRPNKQQRFSPLWLLISTIVLAMTLLFVATRESIYLFSSSFGRHAEARGNQEKALSWYTWSANEWFARDMQLSMAHILLDSGKLEEAEDAAYLYISKNDEDARAWKLMGLILLEEGRFVEAKEALLQAFEYGGLNDLSILRTLLETTLHLSMQEGAREQAAKEELYTLLPNIEKITLDFADAIFQNTHFVALSPNPDEAVKILIILSVLKSEKAEIYQSLITSIEQKVLEERASIEARVPGYLW